MTGFVYKWTHVDSGMMYIGSHKGSTDSNYVGSGLIFKRAIRKYGISSFFREILYEGTNYRAEETLALRVVDAANNPMYYNMKNEALGGSFPGELNGMYGRTVSAETRYLNGSSFRGKKRPDYALRIQGSNNPAFGKSDHAHGIVAYAKSIKGKKLEEIYGEERGSAMREQRHRPCTISKGWKPLTCPHCGLTGRGPNMTRYHFDNCKEYLK